MKRSDIWKLLGYSVVIGVCAFGLMFGKIIFNKLRAGETKTVAIKLR